MGFWGNFAKIAGSVASVAAGVAVGIATVNPLAGAAVAAAGVGASVAIGDAINNNDEIAEQQKTDAISYITSDEQVLNDNLTSITYYLGEISKLNLTIDQNKQNIEVNNEWLAMYQGLLDGEDNLLSQEKTVLQNQIDEATDSLAIANNTLIQQQNSAEAYRQSSELEKENASRQGFTSYADMMKQKSLANVMAGASGGVRSAYTANALNQQNEIKRLIGDDMKFNVLEDASGEGAGSFAKEFMALSNQINNQILANDINIAAAQLNVKTSEDNIQTAQLNLDKTLDEWETKQSSLTLANEDMTKAIYGEDGNGGDQKTVELYLATVNTLQDTAIDKLKEYRKYAGTAGKSSKEQSELINRYTEAYKKTGYEIA